MSNKSQCQQIFHRAILVIKKWVLERYVVENYSNLKKRTQILGREGLVVIPQYDDKI